ncbi:MAG: glycosyltransferase family 39 protein [Spirochaetes bacterium]|nr:glycosyltransferase family 39 protein [Spirochaetota bacterium]
MCKESLRHRIGKISGGGIALVLLFSVVLFSVGILWGLPNDETWCPDSLAPFHPLFGLSTLFSFGYFNKYPLVHQVILALCNLPVVIMAVINSNMMDGLNLHRLLLTIRSTPYATALIVIDRFVSVFMGAGIVFMVFRSAKELFGRRAALLASIIVSTNAILNFHSHVAKVDVPYLFWSMLALYSLIIITRGGTARDHVICAVLICLSFGTKDQAYAIFVIPLVFYFLVYPVRYGKPVQKLRDVIMSKRMGAFVLAFIIGTLVVENVFLNSRGFLMRMAFLLGEGGARSISFSNDIHGVAMLFVQTVHQMMMYGMGVPFFLAGIAGVVIMFVAMRDTREKRARAIIFLLALISYYLFFVQVVRQGVYRFNLPLTVFLSVYAGYFFDLVIRFVEERYGARRRILAYALFLVMAIHPLYLTTSINANFLMDLRYRAEEWMERYIPAGSIIEYYSYRHYLPRFPDGARTYRVKENLSRIEERRPDYIALTSSYYYRFLWSEELRLPKGMVVPERFIRLARENRSYFMDLFGNRTAYRPVQIFKNHIPFFHDLTLLRIIPDHIVIFKRMPDDSREAWIHEVDPIELFKKHPTVGEKKILP